jgi:hypothetical protein
MFVHTSYEQARPWLMTHSERPIDVLDAIHTEMQRHPRAPG